jgi:hypothetical protein
MEQSRNACTIKISIAPAFVAPNLLSFAKFPRPLTACAKMMWRALSAARPDALTVSHF